MIAWAGRPGGLGEETRPALRVAGPSWRAGGRLPPRSAGALHWPIPGASVMAKRDATGYADVFVGLIAGMCDEPMRDHDGPGRRGSGVVGRAAGGHARGAG